MSQISSTGKLFFATKPMYAKTEEVLNFNSTTEEELSEPKNTSQVKDENKKGKLNFLEIWFFKKQSQFLTNYLNYLTIRCENREEAGKKNKLRNFKPPLCLHELRKNLYVLPCSLYAQKEQTQRNSNNGQTKRF